jgi:ribose transport system ATP-binding protein
MGQPKTDLPVLSAKGICKSFPGVKALDAVDFELATGEVHALVGENGAGKSTLMKILAGTYQRDTGTVSVGGEAQALGDKSAARAAGISIVYQESSLLQNLTVAENIFSGDPPRTRFGLIDWPRMRQEARALLATLQLEIAPDCLTGTLSTTLQKMIEVCRALAQDFKVLILDEPTAAITVEETELLFTMIRRLKADGKSIIYISHRLSELTQIADRVTILKDGKRVGSYAIDGLSERDLCEKMVGRELLDFHYDSQQRERVVLEVRELSGDGFEEVSFSVREGEFLTVTGLTGAGRTELALTLFGDRRPSAGQIIVDGQARRFRNPWASMQSGIGYVSEDRKNLGLFLDMSIADNMESNNLDRVSTSPLSDRQALREMAANGVTDFGVKCASLQQSVKELSGGNQQKVSLARWTAFHPKVLIVDEPTLGVDVGAKEEIYNILNQLTAQGMAVIMISSDMLETLSMGDRIMVMCGGRVMKIVEREACSEADIVALASGLNSLQVAS